jgi:hypothetical protein
MTRSTNPKVDLNDEFCDALHTAVVAAERLRGDVSEAIDVFYDTGISHPHIPTDLQKVSADVKSALNRLQRVGYQFWTRELKS